MVAYVPDILFMCALNLASVTRKERLGHARGSAHTHKHARTQAHTHAHTHLPDAPWLPRAMCCGLLLLVG